VITSGSTIVEVIERLREYGGKPLAAVVLVDKKGADMLSEVPVRSMVRIVRLD